MPRDGYASANADMSATDQAINAVVSHIAVEEAEMNWDVIEGNWKQFKGKVKEQWGKLTDDHIDRIAGKRDQLSGKIQETYGIGKDEAEKQIKDFEDRNKDYKP